jgi:hypothetical protein
MQLLWLMNQLKVSLVLVEPSRQIKVEVSRIMQICFLSQHMILTKKNSKPAEDHKGGSN